MKKLLFLICAFSLLLTSANSQEVKVSSAFDTTKIFIGDQISYTITVDQTSEMQLTLPEFKDTLIKNIEILSGPVVDTIRNLEGLVRIKQKYLVTSFDSGNYQLPPVYAELKSEGGLKRFYSDYAYLEVSRIDMAPADSTVKIYDVIDPYRAPLTLGEILPWILITLLAAALVYLLIRYIKKLRRQKSTPEIVTLPDPAHIIAFRDLEILKSEQLWQKGEVKQYYTRLTEILRQYLENRYRIFSLELTTEETLEALVRSGFKKDSDFKILKSVLSGADMVKFAKYNPGAAENESYFQDAWSFIFSTQEAQTSSDSAEIKSEAGEVQQ